MGRWDGDAARFFGWDEATQARVAARKRAKAQATVKKQSPASREIDWRETNWRSTPWQYEGQEDRLVARNDGRSAVGAKK
jgi:hypothetical protein